jgi:hypothetical protein
LLSSRAPIRRRPSIFWRLPFPLAPFVTWNMESHSNLKMLGVRDDETPRTNPRPILPGWARFTSGVSSREKTISLIENPNALGLYELIWQPCWRQRVQDERRILENEKGFKGSWGFAAAPFAPESERLKHPFIFSVWKAWFWIPPTYITSEIGWKSGISSRQKECTSSLKVWSWNSCH